jgi:hypothetical protein
MAAEPTSANFTYIGTLYRSTGSNNYAPDRTKQPTILNKNNVVQITRLPINKDSKDTYYNLSYLVSGNIVSYIIDEKTAGSICGCLS